MKHLIIGGSGFVGTRLISNLGENNCLILDKNDSYFFPKITSIGNILKLDEIRNRRLVQMGLALYN